MAKLIFASIASLDGYTEDASGAFGWSAPDAEVHAFVNELERPIGTYLYGRRMYETMTYWETAPTAGDDELVTEDYARIWQAADKVVYSTTLTAPATARTRIEPAFDPEAIRALKETATSDLSIGGPTLAAHALRAGLVDEISLVLNPIAVGGGKPALPAGLRLPLELLDERRFAGGAMYLHYRVGA